ncbi:MAG: LLM class flavin-dependent oxidoreductase [Sphingobium sp.]|uniref:LLM class flavin-dependent oxidoreductase n=1 Tax=Sphingobium sp. TaxID=1912891 RepID=UPI0029A4201F|nr:LLM class flavin-dependent oxidoreductase [Sphingobium sp.]MDX3909842.1 LLM class flavin-dependent oxidoreductase [Sphingobium sp.]
MTLNIHWLLDPASDPQRSEPGAERHLPSLVRDRRADTRNRFDYYIQIAQAAAQTGFDGLFVRHRIEADESRIVAAVTARAVSRLSVVAEFPASVGSAVYAAKQATTLQRSTGGRFGWAIAPDADGTIRESEADFVANGDLQQRLDEFLTVARGVHERCPFTFKGKFFEVENGGFEAPLTRHPFPKVYLQGEDDAALAVSARHADVHLFRPASLKELAPRIARLKALSEAQGREVAAGLIQPLLVREDQGSAERDAQTLGLEPTVLVGSYDAAAAQIADYVAAGVSELLLEASPALEEAYRVGQHVLPRLRPITDAARRAA